MIDSSIKSPPKIYPIIFLYPLVMYRKFYRGVLWICSPDVLIRNYPDIKKYFIIMSTTSWGGWSHTTVEDIHALTVPSDIEGFKKEFPKREYMVLHETEFISENDYYPIAGGKKYDLIFVSRTAAYKRHHILIRIMYILKNKYHRNIKTLAIATPDYWPIRISNVFKPPLSLKNIVRNIKFEFYRPIIKFLYKKAMMDGLDITLVTERHNAESIRSFYNQSKMYLLLSTYEGTTRTTREAMLCNIPVMVIKDCPAAEAYVNNDTGKAVEDNPDTIAQEIIGMVNNYKSYSPRKWALKNQPRRRACEKLWEKINSIQRFPGYPDIEAATDIRKQFTENKYDNYIDLNNYKGHWGSNVEFFNPAAFDKTYIKIKEKFGKFV